MPMVRTNTSNVCGRSLRTIVDCRTGGRHSGVTVAGPVARAGSRFAAIVVPFGLAISESHSLAAGSSSPALRLDERDHLVWPGAPLRLAQRGKTLDGRQGGLECLRTLPAGEPGEIPPAGLPAGPELEQSGGAGGRVQHLVHEVGELPGVLGCRVMDGDGDEHSWPPVQVAAAECSAPDCFRLCSCCVCMGRWARPMPSMRARSGRGSSTTISSPETISTGSCRFSCSSLSCAAAEQS